MGGGVARRRAIERCDAHEPKHLADGEPGERDAQSDTGSDEEALEEVASLAWKIDNVELLTVGVDVGSSTSHLLFAKLHLQRLSQSLSSRFAVVKREVLHRSPILLTPYRPDGLIDVAALEKFIPAGSAPPTSAKEIGGAPPSVAIAVDG